MPGPKFFIFCFLVGWLTSATRAEVVINEIMYNSSGTPDVEYIELLNSGTQPVDLTGWYLLDDDDGHDRCMLVGTLAAGQMLVAAESVQVFSLTYPGVIGVNPNSCGSTSPGVGFSLSNTLDQVRLFDGSESLIDLVAYTDSAPWPVEPDGGGPSLELLSPVLDNTDAASWTASVVNQGTPGSQNSVFTADLPPVIGVVQRSVDLPLATDPVDVFASVNDDLGLALLELYVDSGSGFVPQPMFDDGLHSDGIAGDMIYGAGIAPRVDGTIVRYYVSATDTLPQSTSEPPAAPAAYFAYTVGHRLPRLMIHELLASNQNGIVDGAGDNDDWLEIRNTGTETVNLQGMFLSNDPGDSRLWALPQFQLGPGSTLLIWCDDETAQGPFHAGFRLAKAAGFIGLYDAVDRGNLLVHGETYGPQNTDVSYGFLPDDADRPELLFPPTPGGSNNGASYFSPVCINEFLAGSQVGVPDWIEIHNRGTALLDIGGWYLSDEIGDLTRYEIPPGTLLGPGEHLTFDQAELGFGIDVNGSEVLLLNSGDGSTGRDFLDYGPQLNDVSYGRFPDGTSNWHQFSAWTLGLPNGCPTQIIGFPPVTGLRFDSPFVLNWDALAGAASYDVLLGNLTALRGASGDFGSAAMSCLVNNHHETLLWESDPTLPGESRFYLVRAVDALCGFGTFGTSDGSEVADRDVLIPAICP